MRYLPLTFYTLQPIMTYTRLDERLFALKAIAEKHYPSKDWVMWEAQVYLEEPDMTLEPNMVTGLTLMTCHEDEVILENEFNFTDLAKALEEKYRTR